MYVLSAAQIRAWDEYTIRHEPIASIDLMERAAGKCAGWLLSKSWTQKQFLIFCGKGNNGGDGLAIARMLIQENYDVTIFILENGKSGTADFQANLQRLHNLTTNIHYMQPGVAFPKVDEAAIIVDALFGTGLQNAVEGFAAELINHLNKSGATIVSIDLPSGLLADQTSKGSMVIHATHTLSFQVYKTALLMQENAPFVGEVEVLDIGLHPAFEEEIQCPQQILDEAWAKKIFKPRNRFAHKGQFGHALLIGGSRGKMGAVLMAARACVHAGAGLTSVLAPACGYQVLQSGIPEAMVLTDPEEDFISLLPEEIDKYTAVGMGPGMGSAENSANTLSFVCRRYTRSLVLDADALNMIAKKKELLSVLPFFSIVTPHPKEFERLFGEQPDDFERLEKAKETAAQFNIIVVLKSHHTAIITPGGQVFFNTTGNAGMAKGGSGDVLTGIITSLLAQGYPSLHAALLGVWLHGAAGDEAAKQEALETMTASDVIECLPKAFRKLYD